MSNSDKSHPPKSDDSNAFTRRRFLQGSVAAAAGVLGLSQGNQAEAAQTDSAGKSSNPFKGKRPNFLILMCDEMRFPPVYESAQTKIFRLQYLRTQNLLRQNGADFRRHYAASVACVPSRASIYTGQYPSLHGATQTTGAAKSSFDPDVFWLDPNSVPTFGDYFRAAGYNTFWRGKWHASDADMLIPGTHDQLLSYNSTTGAPDPNAESLYQSSDRLGRYGLSGWIGPEPHGSAPLNSGSSVPAPQQGRDIGFAQQAQKLIQQLDHDNSTKPWFIVSSFVNPHDITLYGLAARGAGGFEFKIDENIVPTYEDLFDFNLFNQTVADNLANKPSAQASYQATYAEWIEPIPDLRTYYRYYYQLHKNVDDQMWTVLQTLLSSRFKDDTIVIFLSDHGDLLGSHYGMHQKWYTAYDEAIRVPLIIWNKKLFPSPCPIENLTSHIDLLPTLMGLAGVAPEPIRQTLAQDHSDALPLVGRNLSPLLLGEVNPASVSDPLYFMTDDDPSRGLNQENWVGIGYASVVQPNHIESVIARLNGKVWKYSHYFDNPQFWTTPGYPSTSSNPTVYDQVPLNQLPIPTTAGVYTIPFSVTVKTTPVSPDQFEMYNVTDDPMELNNLYGNSAYSAEQNQLAQLLQQQRCAKRLTPSSGSVPGQPTCQP
jgi:choline-sulfatase